MEADFDHVKGSGEREEFETGSVRDTREGKGRFDLILLGWPHALKRLAVHMENGANKYGDRNWEKGQPCSRYLDSAVRHLVAYAAGSRDEDHLAGAAWNILGIIETAHRVRLGLLPLELNDVQKEEAL